MNPIYHTDGTLCVRETERDGKSERDADGYREIYRQRCVRCGGKRKDGVVKRRDNRVKEDEEDERGMKFLFLSGAFITSMGFILVGSRSLVALLSLSLSLYFLCRAQSLLTGVNLFYMLKRNSSDFRFKGYFINTARSVSSS